MRGEAPFGPDQFGDGADQGAAIGPLESLVQTSSRSAEEIGMRLNVDTQQIETIGIPANLDASISLDAPGGMQVAGEQQKLKASIVDLKELAAQLAGELGAPTTMAKVHRFIHAAGVVKDREQLQDIGVGARSESRDATAVLEDARPMADAMSAARWQSIVLQDTGEEGRSEERHGEEG